MAYKIGSTYVIDSKEHIFGCVWNTKKRGRRPKKRRQQAPTFRMELSTTLSVAWDKGKSRETSAPGQFPITVAGADHRDCCAYWPAAHVRTMSKTSSLFQMSSSGAVMKAKASRATDLSCATKARKAKRLAFKFDVP